MSPVPPPQKMRHTDILMFRGSLTHQISTVVTVFTRCSLFDSKRFVFGTHVCAMSWTALFEHIATCCCRLDVKRNRSTTTRRAKHRAHVLFTPRYRRETRRKDHKNTHTHIRPQNHSKVGDHLRPTYVKHHRIFFHMAPPLRSEGTGHKKTKTALMRFLARTPTAYVMSGNTMHVHSKGETLAALQSNGIMFFPPKRLSMFILVYESMTLEKERLSMHDCLRGGPLSSRLRSGWPPSAVSVA